MNARNGQRGVVRVIAVAAPCPLHRRLSALSAALALGSLVTLAHADTLVLRSAVRARTDEGAIMLRDVATLDGEELGRYADVIVATVPTGSPAKELGVEEIRRRLEEAGANWAKIDLEGRRVVIRPRVSDDSGAPAICAGASVEPGRAKSADRGAATANDAEGPRGETATGDRDANPKGRSGAIRAEPKRFDPTRTPRKGAAEPIVAASVTGESSVRAIVADALVKALNESPESLRMTFDGLDAVTLAETPMGLRIEVEPIGVIAADRAEFAIRWWRDGRVERRTNLSVFPEVARLSSVAASDLRKGDEPGDRELTSAVCWFRPSDRHRVVRPGAAGGRTLANAVHEGEPLLDSLFERTLLVKRGDRIVVRSLVGSLAVSVDAVAQSDGREGEMIECVRIGTAGRSKTTFNATVVARGEAVIQQNGRPIGG